MEYELAHCYAAYFISQIKKYAKGWQITSLTVTEGYVSRRICMFHEAFSSLRWFNRTIHYINTVPKQKNPPAWRTDIGHNPSTFILIKIPNTPYLRLVQLTFFLDARVLVSYWLMLCISGEKSSKNSVKSTTNLAKLIGMTRIKKPKGLPVIILVDSIDLNYQYEDQRLFQRVIETIRQSTVLDKKKIVGHPTGRGGRKSKVRKSPFVAYYEWQQYGLDIDTHTTHVLHINNPGFDRFINENHPESYNAHEGPSLDPQGR